MELTEQYYKKTIASIGWSLVVFWGFLQLYGIGITFLSEMLYWMRLPAITANVIYQLTYAAGYLAVFMIPVAFLRLFLKKNGCRPMPMRMTPRISPWMPAIIFAGLAICFSAAQLNSALVSVFDYGAFSSEVLWDYSENMQGYEIVLNFIVIAVVPGFCEEFLFRGAILESCLPFGRTNAIIISSFLFSMMHQNVEQMLYTFVAGIILGLVYDRTGSLWCCTLLHIINNFVSVLENSIYGTLGSSLAGNLVLLLIEAVIFLLGAVSIAVLIVRFFSEKKTFSDGVFAKDVPSSDSYALAPVSSARAVRLFCTPSMILFLTLCVLQALSLVVMAVGRFY